MSVETLSRPNAVPTHIILSVGLRQRLPFCYSVVLYRYLLPNNAPFRKRGSSPVRQFAGLFLKYTPTRAHGGVLGLLNQPAKWRTLPKQCTLLIFIQLPVILQNKYLAGLAHEHSVFLRLLADKWVFFCVIPKHRIGSRIVQKRRIEIVYLG